MEFERFLFKIHEFWLSRECCGPCLSITFKVSAILLFLQLPFFFYGNYAFVGKTQCLGPEIATNYTFDLHSNISALDQNKVIRPQDVVNIRIREPKFELANNNSEEFNYAHLEFSGEDYIVSLDGKIKHAHNFTYHNITIDVDCYATTIAGKYALGLLGFQTILMNEIIVSMKGFDVHIKNLHTMQTFRYSAEKVRGIQDWSKQKYHLLSIFFNLLGILFGLFLIFTVVALYVRIFYMYFPIWFFLGTGRNTRLQQEVIRQYSWIGLYFHTLQINGKKTFWMFLSLYLCHLLFGRLVHAVQVYWNFLLFDKAYPRSISADFYDLVYWAEFVSLTFIRTRTSLKYVPRFTILFMVMFIYYFQHTVYGFYDLALSLLRCCIYGSFAYFLLTFEIAALHWNSSSHYTPSIESPRTLYFPIFSLTWMHDLPPIWTMFYPLFGRSHFTSRELSLVNGNYGLLRHTLENAHNREGINEADQDFGLGAEAPNNQVEVDQNFGVGGEVQNNQVEIEMPNVDQREGSDENSGQNLIQNVSH